MDTEQILATLLQGVIVRGGIVLFKDPEDGEEYGFFGTSLGTVYFDSEIEDEAEFDLDLNNYFLSEVVDYFDPADPEPTAATHELKFHKGSVVDFFGFDLKNYALNYIEQSHKDCKEEQARLLAQGLETVIRQDHDCTYYLLPVRGRVTGPEQPQTLPRPDSAHSLANLQLQVQTGRQPDFTKFPAYMRKEIGVAERDYNLMLENIANPPPPTEALVKAAKDFRSKYPKGAK